MIALGKAENTAEDLASNEDGVPCVFNNYHPFYVAPSLKEKEVKRKVKGCHMAAVKGWLILTLAKYRH